jgi:3-keto-disaccharide hydrolase
MQPRKTGVGFTHLQNTRLSGDQGASVKQLLVVLLAWCLAPIGRAGGAILLQDNFNDGNAAGWEEFDGSFAVTNGVFEITSSGFCADARAVDGDPSWSDYSLDVDFQYGSGNAAAVLFRVETIESGCDAGRYYQFYAFPDVVGFCLMNFSGGACTVLKEAAASTPADVWHHLRLDVSGVTATAAIDGTEVLTHDGFSAYPTGRIGLKRIDGGTNRFDNVVVCSGGDCSASCGNGDVEPGEKCDSGSATGGFVGGTCGFCTASCTCRCGNGSVDDGEECDSGSASGGFVGGSCGFCSGECACETTTTTTSTTTASTATTSTVTTSTSTPSTTTTSTVTTTTIPRKECRAECKKLRQECRAACTGTKRETRACKRACTGHIRTPVCRKTGSCFVQ